MSSLRDVWLVARFELLRAIRTWRALALLALYTVATAGATWVFTRVIWGLENVVAEQLGAPRTQRPGAMLQKLQTSDTYQELVSALVGGDHLAVELLQLPPLALFHLWLGFALLPMFAAAAAAECISVDLSSRALRFEAARTGRLEIVLGRFVGQLVLTAAATVVAGTTVWAVGLWAMTGHDPIGLAAWLGAYSFKAWLFAVPFVGAGTAASMWTTSAAWARVMAIGTVAGSWVGLGVARYAQTTAMPVTGDLLLQVLPQGWIRTLWAPAPTWWAAAAVLTALGLAALGLGYFRMAGRDL